MLIVAVVYIPVVHTFIYLYRVCIHCAYVFALNRLLILSCLIVIVFGCSHIYVPLFRALFLILRLKYVGSCVFQHCTFRLEAFKSSFENIVEHVL